MKYALQAEAVEAYRRDGYLFPLDIFNQTQAAEIKDELEQAKAEGATEEQQTRRT